MMVVGVDACKTGWIAVGLADDKVPRAEYLATIADVVDAFPDASVVGIDIPIGLPHGGRRAADVLAKQVLGARRSSVFFTPPRAVLEAPTHAVATSAAVRLTGLGISQQSYGLRHKILEVDRWLDAAPCRVIEVHPEVSFTRLLGRPALAGKKTWAGMVERRTALVDLAGIDLDHVAGPAALLAATDDMLDAGVVAWSARRFARGSARPMPDPPERFDGREAAIWA